MKTGGLSEDAAKALAEKFKPVLYFHSDETHFPTNINDYSINWSSATLDNKDATVDTNGFKGNTSLKQDAPYYVSILENSDGTCRITYIFHYAWNPAGPTMHFKAKLAGVGIDTKIVVGNYGMGIHYGDVEHIEVTLNSGYGSIKSVKYAWHSESKTLTSGYPVEDSTHPVVYVAKGSHASYYTSGTQTYMTWWDKSKKVLGVTVYDTYCEFYDYAPSTKLSNMRWYSTNVRVLKLNGNQMSGLSTNELYIGFKYSGHLGLQYNNLGVDLLKDAMGYTTFYKALKVVSKSTANDIDDKLDEKLNEAEAEVVATASFYGRSWW